MKKIARILLPVAAVLSPATASADLEDLQEYAITFFTMGLSDTSIRDNDSSCLLQAPLNTLLAALASYEIFRGNLYDLLTANGKRLHFLKRDESNVYRSIYSVILFLSSLVDSQPIFAMQDLNHVLDNLEAKALPMTAVIIIGVVRGMQKKGLPWEALISLLQLMITAFLVPQFTDP